MRRMRRTIAARCPSPIMQGARSSRRCDSEERHLRSRLRSAAAARCSSHVTLQAQATSHFVACLAGTPAGDRQVIGR